MLKFSPLSLGFLGKEIAPWTHEFIGLLEAVEASGYLTPDPLEACVFLPAIDLLNENSLEAGGGSVQAGRALKATPFWNGGKNNLVFTMLPGKISRA